MTHPLEVQYGLTAHELLEALNRRFRAKVTLEGAVAEVHMEKHIRGLVGKVVERYEVHDADGHPDFSIWLPDRALPVLAECKNVRDEEEAYRTQGRIVAFKVETQKTRASKADPSSRFYGVGQFQILGACLGKKTKRWSDFMFVRTSDLERHGKHVDKLAVMQRVPLPDSRDPTPWSSSLGELLKRM